MLNLNVPDLDGKKIQKAIERVFKDYRFYKVITFDEREATLTASYEVKEGTSGGMHSDQTGSIAVHNAEIKSRMDYCRRIERFAERLPGREKLLIKSRYMDEDYTTDIIVYTDMGIAPVTYMKIRAAALYKLAMMMIDFNMIQIDDIVLGSKNPQRNQTKSVKQS